MKQSEFNKMMAFQPSVPPYNSLRELVDEYFANEYSEDAVEEMVQSYVEEIRKTVVTEEGV